MVIFLYFAIVTQSFAQYEGKEIPNKRYSSNKRLSYHKYHDEFSNSNWSESLIVSLGYSNYTLLNSIAQREFDKPLSNLYGWDFSIEYQRLMPLTFAFNYSSNVFSNQEQYQNWDENGHLHVQNIGLSGALSLLPFSHWFNTYVGSGIHYSTHSVGYHLLDGTASQFEYQSELIPFWKVGVNFNLREKHGEGKITLGADYRQSFETGGEYDFSQIVGRIGFRPGENFFNGGQKEEMKEQNWIVSYGFHQTSFFNEAFNNRLRNGNITHEWGHVVNMRYTQLYPFILDFGFISSVFNVNDLPGWTYPDTVNIRHRGFELAANLPILPATKFFVPYIGGGYQLAHLYVGPPVVKAAGVDYSNIPERSMNLSTAIFKGGTMINVGDLSFWGEYKRSISIAKERSFYQLAVGVGFKL